MDGQSDVFSQLFVKCKETGKNTNDLELEILLDRLLKLDYSKRIYAVTTKIAGEVLCHFACSTNLLISKNEYLLHKFFQLSVHLTSSQEIVLEEAEANSLLSKMREVWVNCLNNYTSLQSLLDAVAAISYLNGPYISTENMTFLLQNGESGLYSIAKNDSLDKDIRKVAVQCLYGFCSASVSGELIPNERMSVCLKYFISILQNTTTDTPHDVKTCKVVFSSLKGIHIVLSSEFRAHLQSIGPLLAVLKKFMVYGLPGVTHSSPHELQPVPIPALHPTSKQEEEDKSEETPAKAQPQQTKKKKKKPKSKSKFNKGGNAPTTRTESLQSPMAEQVQLRPMWAKVTSSESEYSDTEGAQRAKLRSFLSKIRHMSLSALHLTVKNTDKHTMLGYWSSFLPESGATDDPATLFKSFKEDPTPKCRATALGVLGALLDGSRRYLAFAAEETGSPSHSTPSFVPFSVSLAASIREIHKQLIITSSKEQSTMALTQLLKTLTNLVFNTPYRKMKPGLLVKVSSQARYFLISTRDNNLKVVALTLLGAVTSTSVPLAEVANILTDMSQMSTSTPRSFSGPDTPVELRSVLSESTSSGSSWLIDLCVSFARLGRKMSKPTSTQFFEQDQPEVPFAIRSEAISTLAKIAKGYLAVVKGYVSILGDLICQCLQDSIPAIQLNAAKLLEELGGGIVQIVKLQNSEKVQCEALAFWMKILDGPLQTAMQDHEAPLLQAKGCDCLSTMSPAVFSKLNKNVQMMCIALLSGFSSEENASVVRSAAVRALGILAMFPTLREDVIFLEDVSLTVISILQESPILIRANAAWTFGNLTDTLVINKEIRPHFVAEFRPSLLRDIFEQAFKSIGDKARVVFNMMRVLGNLIRYANENLVADPAFQPLLLKATHILSDMVSCDAAMVKVRWNACTACCNLLSNDKLPLGDPEWTDHVYDSLCSSVSACKNFKVRIKAALALSTPKTRQQFGSKYIKVLKSLVQGFEESKLAVDFVEYQFRDTLQEQLCTTLVHALSMLSSEDASGLSEVFIGKSNEIKDQLDHYYGKLTQLVDSEKFANHSSVTHDSCVTSDPVEQYILVKQPSPGEKLAKFKSTVEYLKAYKLFPSHEDVALGAVGKTYKCQSDSVNLYEMFTALEIND